MVERSAKCTKHNKTFQIWKIITYLRKQQSSMPVDAIPFTKNGPTVTGHLAICLGYCKNQKEPQEIKGKSVYDFIQNQTGWSLKDISELTSLSNKKTQSTEQLIEFLKNKYL